MASGSQCEEHTNYWIPARMCVVTSDVSSISASMSILGMLHNDLCQQPLITVCISTGPLGVGAPCTVLFADKCTA